MEYGSVAFGFKVLNNFVHGIVQVLGLGQHLDQLAHEEGSDGGFFVIILQQQNDRYRQRFGLMKVIALVPEYPC